MRRRRFPWHRISGSLCAPNRIMSAKPDARKAAPARKVGGGKSEHRPTTVVGNAHRPVKGRDDFGPETGPGQCHRKYTAGACSRAGKGEKVR